MIFQKQSCLDDAFVSRYSITHDIKYRAGYCPHCWKRKARVIQSELTFKLLICEHCNAQHVLFAEDFSPEERWEIISDPSFMQLREQAVENYLRGIIIKYSTCSFDPIVEKRERESVEKFQKMMKKSRTFVWRKHKSVRKKGE